MATTQSNRAPKTSLSPRHGVRSTRAKSTVQQNLLLAVLLCHAPFVVKHVWDLTQFRPHYGFVSVLFLAIAWLGWNRWPGQSKSSTRSTRFGWSVLLAGTAVLALAVAILSPWLATAALLINAAGVGIVLLGANARKLLGPWLLSWLALPPPFGLDSMFIQKMQGSTAMVVSSFLDWYEIDHFLTGCIFHFPDATLFVAEACSGVHSQIVLVAVALVMAVYQRRSVGDTLVLTLSALFWSASINAVRIAIVTVLAVQFQCDMTQGWSHEALGLGLILVGFLLLLSTDQLLHGLHAILFQPDDFCEPARDERRYRGRSTGGSSNGADHSDRSGSSVGSRQIRLDPAALRQRAVPGLRLRPLVLLLAITVTLSCLQLAVVAKSVGSVQFSSTVSPLREDLLARSVGAWRLEQMSVKHRERGSDEAEYSQIWRYRNGANAAQVSVDFPFFGWHELTDCYQGRGWRVVRRQTMPLDSTCVDRCVKVEMIGPSGEHGLLMFCLIDAAGNSVDGHSEYWRNRIAQSPLASAIRGQWNLQSNESTTQVQLVSINEIAQSDAAQRELMQLFSESADAVCREIQTGGDHE